MIMMMIMMMTIYSHGTYIFILNSKYVKINTLLNVFSGAILEWPYPSINFGIKIILRNDVRKCYHHNKK